MFRFTIRDVLWLTVVAILSPDRNEKDRRTARQVRAAGMSRSARRLCPRLRLSPPAWTQGSDVICPSPKDARHVASGHHLGRASLRPVLAGSQTAGQAHKQRA